MSLFDHDPPTRSEELLSILRDLLVEEGEHPDAWLLGRLHSMPLYGVHHVGLSFETLDHPGDEGRWAIELRALVTGGPKRPTVPDTATVLEYTEFPTRRLDDGPTDSPPTSIFEQLRWRS